MSASSCARCFFFLNVPFSARDDDGDDQGLRGLCLKVTQTLWQESAPDEKGSSSLLLGRLLRTAHKGSVLWGGPASQRLSLKAGDFW